ncbi:retroviral-like aspartic protease family protein [Povalibacter sp.]|uniref:retroviral-like aspartic protease family protein n=1 Tax=Povalibacter sp. TaxID=1962978 RepID=UPI002F41FF9A
MNRARRLILSHAAALLAALLIPCIDVQASASAGRSPPPTDPISIPFPSLEPDHLYAAPTRPDRIGRVLAPVMINGRGPFRMMVDTGANQSVLTQRLADAAGLTVDALNTIKLNGVTGAFQVPTANVESFETGDLRQQGLQLPVMNAVMGGADGILGMQGFDGLRLSVDFLNDQISIDRSRAQRPPPGFARLPVKIHFNRLLLASGRVGGVRVHAVIDTGAERTLGNMALRRALQARKSIDKPPKSTGVIGLSEVMQRGEMIYTRKLRLGDIAVTDVDVIYGDIDVFRLWDLEDEPAMLIGMDVLGTVHTLVVDYRLKEVHIRPRS